ncbi:putative FGGY-family carbohydrate kinase [Aspergillus aurantiobrunneus]
MVSFKHGDHYIGVDVGTGSARACVIDHTGSILGLASICTAVKQAVQQCGVPTSNIRGLAFDATCSLAVFSKDTDRPVSLSGSDPSNGRNVILWLDHRAVEEKRAINATGHPVLQYVGGGMSVEMEMPKILWLKKHLNALTHLATGKESRSYCSVICKQGYLASGTERGEEGWQLDFLTSIGLGDLAADVFIRLGGINGKNGVYLSAGECVGPLDQKAAAELGLSPGIAVGSGVIDAYAGWIDTVGAKVDLRLDDQDVSHRLAVVAGTSTCHLAMSNDELFVPGVWGPYRDSATGELIRHVVESHAAYSAAKAAAQQAGMHIYSFLNDYFREEARQAQVAHAAQLAKHFFYGDLWGNRSPIADPQMSGTIIRLRSDQSLKNLALHYYGFLEFIALQTRQIIDTMNKNGHQISTVFMSGSQTQNDILSKDLWAIMGQMSKPGRRVDPTSDADEQWLLQAKYEVFLDMCFKQREYRELVDT